MIYEWIFAIGVFMFGLGILIGGCAAAYDIWQQWREDE